MAKQDIIDALEDLTIEDFASFRWYLGEDRKITQSKLEKTGQDRRKTVDCMVQTFTEEAAKITVDILKKISRNDLADKLQIACSRPKDFAREISNQIYENKPNKSDYRAVGRATLQRSAYVPQYFNEIIQTEEQGGHGDIRHHLNPFHFELAAMVKAKFEDNCSVCLEVFIQPVSLPCGHSFCNVCITKYWDDIEVYQCPIPECTFTLDSRPELHVSCLISGRKPEQPTVSAKVFCDMCSNSQVEAVKSCIDCNMSYCETCLEPHHRVPVWKTHQLVSPVSNLEDRMCKKHNKILEFFCRVDKRCICRECTYPNHKNHTVVKSEDECKKRRRQMGDERKHLDKLIRERKQKMKELNRSEKSNKEEADKEKKDCNEAYTALVESIRKNQADIIAVIERKQREVEEVLQGFIEELDEELDDLLRRRKEIEELLSTDDRLYALLLNNEALCTSPTTTKDWSPVGINSEIYVGMASAPLAEMEKHLNTEMEMLFKDMEMVNHDLVDNLERIQQLCAVDVLLDPDTANPYLILSKDGTEVRAGKKKHRVMINPTRFDATLNVLGRQGFSSGRFYYEVEVKGKIGWTLGVAKESVDRNGTTVHIQDGYWTIGLVEGKYKSSDNTDVPISHGRMPVKIGVFVSHTKGKVSFYDVEGRAIIYSFTGCSFTEKIYPVFNPCANHRGINCRPLIITPVVSNF